MDLFNDQHSSAIFSEDRKYRYVLTRIWDLTKPRIMFIGLNPSTANENEPDNTITKVRKVAAFNGYGGFYMCNLFGIISAKPEILLTHPDPRGEQDDYIMNVHELVNATCFCWGTFKQAKLRAEVMVHYFGDEALCFKKTKHGHPWHPLYCLDKTTLIKY